MGNTLNHSMKIVILLSLSFVIIATVFYFVDPIPQDPSYHQFADQQEIFGIANFSNVVSNLAFILIGLYGLISVVRHSRETEGFIPQTTYYVFFIGLILIGIGSGYYHLSPNNQTLVWDRLPITIAFMGIFSFIICEHINHRIGSRLLWPLLVVGILSVLYWNYTENQGAGDLRWYALVQFLPILLIPLIIIMFPSKSYQKKYLWYIIGAYVLAKITEHFDEEIMNVLLISGHTMKHVLAALPGIAFLQLILSKSNTTNHNHRVNNHRVRLD